MPAMRTCIECGTVTTQSRCPAHARGTTTQRGYGYGHERARVAHLQDYDPTTPCWRCGQPLGDDPSALALDHDDTRTAYKGLVHLNPCNSGKRVPGGAPL